MLAARSRLKFVVTNKWPTLKISCNLLRNLSSRPAIFNELLEKFSETDGAKCAPFKPPEHFNFARDIVDQWAQLDSSNSAKQKEPLAFWFVDETGTKVKWTYSEFSRESQKAANALAELGANKIWNKSVLILPKVPHWWTINIGSIRLGVVLVVSTSLSTAKDIEYRLQTSKAQCIITNPRIAEAVDSIQHTCPNLKTKILVCEQNSIRPGWQSYQSIYDKASPTYKCENTKSSDKLQVFFTSGTTSMPKRVMQSHGNLGLGFFHFGRFVLKLDRNVLFWNIADTGWAKAAWSSLFSPLLLGATIFVHAMPQFNPQETLKTLVQYPINGMCAPPTVYRMLLLLKVPQLDMNFFSAGEPLNAEVNKQWLESTGKVIRSGYGQTESPPLIGDWQDPRIDKFGTTGKALSYLDITILDEDFKPAPVGVTGHIGLRVIPERPLGLFLGYEDQPEKTAATVKNGYYITGDTAYKDEDGYFWFHSRSDDVITSAAYRIGPFEVESALQEHPDVLESAVVGSPDQIRGEVVKAFIVLRESGKGKDPEKLILELQNHVKNTTAPYKYPRKIEFVEGLPKTISGKIKRAELRKKEMEMVK